MTDTTAAAGSVSIAIAPETSTSAADAILTQTVSITDGGSYAAIVINDASGSGIDLVFADTEGGDAASPTRSRSWQSMPPPTPRRRWTSAWTTPRI